MRPLPLFLALAALAGCATPGESAAPASRTADDRDAGQRELDARLKDCGQPEACVGRAAQIAVEEREGTPLQVAAQESAIVNMRIAKSTLIGLFEQASTETRIRIYRLFDLGWSNMHQGTDFLLDDLFVRGLSSSSPALRTEAARVAARHPLRTVSHFIVDAAELDPKLTIYALRALELNADHLLSRWVVAHLDTKDPVVRAQAQRTLYVFDRNAMTAIRERLAAQDPAVRRPGVEGLLVVAVPDDVPTLRTWLEEHGDDDKLLAERVTRAIAELEAGAYRFPVPTAPAL